MWVEGRWSSGALKVDNELLGDEILKESLAVGELQFDNLGYKLSVFPLVAHSINLHVYVDKVMVADLMSAGLVKPLGIVPNRMSAEKLT